jgi:hypothetical protein
MHKITWKGFLGLLVALGGILSQAAGWHLSPAVTSAMIGAGLFLTSIDHWVVAASAASPGAKPSTVEKMAAQALQHLAASGAVPTMPSMPGVPVVDPTSGKPVTP